MKAVVLTRRGPPEVLEVEDRPDPKPGRGEVTIRVAAAGVSFADLLSRVGLYPNAPKLPAVIGYEVAGTVAATGAEVHGVSVGERVAAFVRRGGYAECAIANQNDLVRLPPGMSFEQGAAIPLSYATAYGALVRYGAAQSGERVLIHGAGGAVGTAATALANAMGLEVWGTASPRKHARLVGLGVKPLDYTSRNWHQGLPSFDLVLDALGGASFRLSYRLLGAGGRLVCYGASSVLKGERRSIGNAARTLLRTPRFNAMKQVGASKTVIGLDTVAIWDSKGDLGELIGPLGPLVLDGVIDPDIAASFPFTRAADAHRLITERGNFGKVVLVPDQQP
jgi:NADPH:quinone reductase-like Zn-dependent oxidoreductase